jgi:hypothetical protein
MQEFMPCEALKKLDDAHSTMVTLIEQGNASAVLTTLASVLGNIRALDKGENDPIYWDNVIVNLNTLADTLASKELSDETLFDESPSQEDWELAELLEDDDPLLADG